MSSHPVLPPGGEAEHARQWRYDDRGWAGVPGMLLLVADPDPDPDHRTLDSELSAAGVATLWCKDGAEALVEYGRRQPDAVLAAPLLDVVDTTAVVRALRDAGCRTVLLGIGPDDLEAAGPALVAGATGAVARPYVAAEVTGRLAAQARDLERRHRLVYGPLEIDSWAYRVRVGGMVLDNLPLKEFELLRLLMAHADRVVTPEQIRSALWGDRSSVPSSNAITVHVGRLRHRLEGVAEIRTLRGRGYRLTV